MDWSLPLLIVGSTMAGGLLAGVAYLLVGGTGVSKQHTRQLRAIADDLDDINARITRDQNRRKADASVAARAEKKTAQELRDEAELLLAAKPSTPKEPIVPGFGGKFSHG